MRSLATFGDSNMALYPHACGPSWEGVRYTVTIMPGLAVEPIPHVEAHERLRRHVASGSSWRAVGAVALRLRSHGENQVAVGYSVIVIQRYRARQIGAKTKTTAHAVITAVIRIKSRRVNEPGAG
jgi:hypothetical protein